MSKTRSRNHHVAAKRITKRRDRLMVMAKRRMSREVDFPPRVRTADEVFGL